MERDEYLKNPCGMSSIPLWKTKQMEIPDSIRIVHNDDFDPRMFIGYSDSKYFRLIHTLQHIPEPVLPAPFIFSTASVEEYAAHINACYADIGISEQVLSQYTLHPVYCPELWIAVRNAQTGEIVATAIAELDHDISEGILEWVQVSGHYRRIGIGSCIVTELLRRLKVSAAFVTVSGRLDDPSHPEILYRKCGFTGNDIWHILNRASHKT